MKYKLEATNKHCIHFKSIHKSGTKTKARSHKLVKVKYLAIAVGRKNIHTVPFLHCKTTKIQPFIFSVVMHSSVPRSEMLLPINFLKGAACYTNRAEWSQPVRFAVVETQIHWGREVVGICLLSSVASLEDILDCPQSITVQLNYSCLYESLMACSGSNEFSFIKEWKHFSLLCSLCLGLCFLYF